MRPFASQLFRAPDQDWRREPDGSLVNAIETEEGQLALRFVRQLFDEGLVHPNEGSEGADIKQLFRSGEIIFRTDGWGDWEEALAAVLADNPSYNQQPVPFFAHDGGAPMVHGTDPAWAYTFLHRDLTDEQIEELLDVADWLAAPFGTEEYELHQYGVEGVHFDRDADGEPQLTEQGQGEAGRPIPTYYFICGRPPEPFQGPWPGYVESRLEWSNQHVGYVQPRIFDGLRRIEPAALQRANQALDDAVENFIRGRVAESELERLVEDWRTSGGEEGRGFYLQALEERDASREGGQ